jgi:hypothetical protein
MAVQVVLRRCVQDSQELGSNDEHMVSRVFFTIDVEGVTSEGHVDIKQVVGSDYEKGPLEVGRPSGYSGPMDYDAFRAEVERYYRSLIGSTAKFMRVAPGAKATRFFNNTFNTAHAFTMAPKGQGAGW